MKIKGIVALFLTVSMMLSFFGSVAVVAEFQGQSGNEIVFDADGDNSSKNKGIIHSCVYDSASQKIVINGSVMHDVFISHREYSINLYKISPEHSLKTVLGEADVTLLASTSISIKFNFTADARELDDIFSQYVVALVSKDGKVDYVGDRLYPFVESQYLAQFDRTNYKGAYIPETQQILQSEPSLAVVPVYLDKLMSAGTTGYLYSLEGTHIFFDKEYIDSLDRTVRSLYSCGAKIYLQLLLNNTVSHTDTKYDIPDIFSVSVMKEIYSYCDFLSDRYSSYKNGYVDGIILGKNLDDTEEYNNDRYADEEKYTNALALYGVIAGTAIRKNIPSADISYSFTSANTYGAQYDRECAFESSRMIDTICAYFDEFYSDGFNFSITLESSCVPLSISNDTLVDTINLSAKYDGKQITEQNMSVFSDFLSSLDDKYSSAPSNFIYVWNVDSALSGNALSCAYTYLYYKLFAQEKLSAFVVSFEDNPSATDDLVNIMKYIDTYRGVELTFPLLTFFRKNNWEEVVSGFNSFDLATRKHNKIEILESIPEKTVGEFLYFDFSDSSTYNSWFAGRGIGSVSIDYHKELGRSLCAEINTDILGQTEYAYLFNSYEYPENFMYTPYLTIALAIEDNDGISDIFEVEVAFENSGNIYEASRIVHTGEATYLHFDVSAFSSNHIAENIRVSVRPMSNTAGDYKLFISSIKGSSTDFNDDELKMKIEKERLRIRNSLVDEDKKLNSQTTFLIIIVVVLAAVILSVMLFFFLRREDSDIENDK